MEQCTLAVVRDDRWKYVHFAGLPPCCSTSRTIPISSSNRATDPDCAPRWWPSTPSRLLSWRMRHDERTLTGHLVTPRASSPASTPASADPFHILPKTVPGPGLLD